MAAPSDSTDLLAFSTELQNRFEAASSASARKEQGQVFTPASVAAFMASLLAFRRKELAILDPGAGVGSLTAAVCGRVLQQRSRYSVDLHLFESDNNLLPYLRENMERCRKALTAAGHRVAVTIHPADFILATTAATDEQLSFSNGGDASLKLPRFDAAILNPPYFKIRGDSAYALAMTDVVHGQPNIYSLFLAQAARLLRPGGQLAAITPRSFCNGLYFRDFRRWFFSTMGLERIHLFDSRKHTFKDVLQESVITVSRRLGKAPTSVEVSSSFGPPVTKTLPTLSLPPEDVLDDTCGQALVRIPTSRDDVAIIELAHRWRGQFADLGLKISTGPVVLFRAKQFALAEKNGRHTAPLFSVHNVHPFATTWPVEKRGKPKAFEVSEASRNLLVPTKNYVLLRRFSAKEERRRLTASPLLSTDLPGPYRALENHLNYVYHGDRDLTVDETFGLVALFNSALFDRYFRTFSGNTQVNATEVRTLPFPDLETVQRIGKRVRRLKRLPSKHAETAVLDELGVDGALKEHLEATAR